MGQSYNSHCPLLLRRDHVRARVESIGRFPSQFTFLPLILNNHVTDLIILPQDSFHLKKNTHLLSRLEGNIHYKVYRGSLMQEGV